MKKNETAHGAKGFLFMDDPLSDTLPSRVKLVDTQRFVRVNLDEMHLDSDDRPYVLKLREKSFGLQESTAIVFFSVILHALNGKRKVSTVIRWVNEFSQFSRSSYQFDSISIRSITLAMFNRYAAEKNASQVKMLRSILKYWLRCKKPGIENELAAYLTVSKSPKPRHTFEIQSEDAQERPFSLHQVRVIISRIDTLYMSREFNPQDNLLWRLIVSEGMRPSQLRLLRISDVEQRHEVAQRKRIEMWVPIVKQMGTPARSYMALTTLSESVSRAIIEHITFIQDVLGHRPPDELPLFCVNTKTTSDPKIQTSGISIYNKIHRTRGRIAMGIPELDDLDLFTRRFKHTKLTHFAVLGAPIEVLARAGFQTSTVSLKHYTNLSEDAFSDYEDKLSDEHTFIHNAFKGTIVDSADATNLDLEHTIFDSNLDQTVGSCSGNPCNVFAPIGCYDCPRFEAFRDGAHEVVLDFLLKRRKTAEEMGLPLDSLNRDDHMIASVRAVIHEIQLGRDE